MRFFEKFIAIFFFLPLLCHAASPFLASSNFSDFRRNLLQSGKIPAFSYPVVIEGNGTHWAAVFERILSDDELFKWKLQFPLVIPEEEVAEGDSFREANHWTSGPHWAVFDGRGKLIVDDDQELTRDFFIAKLQSVNSKPPIETLEDFWKSNPNRQDVLHDLVVSWINIGCCSMSNYYKRHTQRGTDQVLTDQDDSQIWGQTAFYLDQFLNGEGWRNGETLELIEGYPYGLNLSSLLKRIARKYISAVEEQIRRNPGCRAHWKLWLELHSIDGSRPLHTFLDGIVFVPGHENECPKDLMISTMVSDCVTPQDWRSLANFLNEFWNAMRMESIPVGISDEIFNGYTDTQWKQVPSNLILAWLKCGEYALAENVLAQANQWWPSGNTCHKASELAESCGLLEVAERWSQGPNALAIDPESLVPPIFSGIANSSVAEPNTKNLNQEIPIWGTLFSNTPFLNNRPEDKIKILEKFINAHSDVTEARQYLIQAYTQLAGSLTKDVSAQNESAWCRVARAMEPLAQTGEWLQGKCLRLDSVSMGGWSSKCMRLTVSRILPILEESLKDRPSDPRIWSLWAQLAPFAPGTSVSRVLARIEPSPFELEWPPEAALDSLAKEGRETKDWRSLVTWLQPLWDWRFEINRPSKADGSLLLPVYSKHLWDQVASPLVEAYLNLKQDERAEELLNQFWSCFGEENLVSHAVAVAIAARRMDVASRWALRGTTQWKNGNR